MNLPLEQPGLTLHQRAIEALHHPHRPDAVVFPDSTGEVLFDLDRMIQLLRVSADDLDVTVQARVTRKQLNALMKDSGLFFPLGPGAEASTGGMAATRASGTSGVCYGTMRDKLLSLTVVLSDGRVVRTSRRSRKAAAVYKRGIPVARIETPDDVRMNSPNCYSGMGHPATNTLFIEFHGSDAGVTAQAEAVQAVASDHGGGAFKWAVKPGQRNAHGKARHDVTYASKAPRPGCEIRATDVRVPISRLVMRALAMDGTSTGEHGIGLGKRDYLIAGGCSRGKPHDRSKDEHKTEDRCHRLQVSRSGP